MAKLIIMYDPNDRLNFNSHDLAELKIDHATLSVAEDLKDNDIYAIARKLAEMLLEQF